MTRPARRFVRGTAPLALLTVLLAGCSGTTDGEKDAGSGASGARARVGGEGSPCALPVSFALVEGWEPDATDAVTATPDPKVTSSLVCEISGRAAGTPALLRVWMNATGERNPRRALEVFVDGFHGKPTRVAYSEIEAGQFTGAEVVFAEGYRTERPKVEMTRAFAVSTGKDVAIVHLWGNAADEAGLLSAYELAKRTVRPSG